MRKVILAIFLIALIAALSAGCVRGTENVHDVLHEESSAGNQETTVETPADQPADEDADMEGAEESETGEQPVEKSAQEEPVKRYYMNKIYDIKPLDEETDDRVVLLTFDDGPKDLEMIQSMLETLEKHEAKAIFFVNGFRVQSNPELLQMIHDAGHAIGNHSWDHIALRKQTDEVIRQQVDDVQKIVEETIGVKPLFFRPPHGSSNEFLRAYVKEQGMLFMTWSNGSLDWDRNHQTPESVVQNVLDQLRPGSNILMHELPWTVEALDELLTRLTEEGYGFVDPFEIQIETEEAAVEETGV
ncbi:hypothetical protein PRECH8_01550 [Insulibacter thermoxylanivorax]|uniref:NodB homology domain-containing protein n=1 Tax=Insulibacter thermoxylanivorax TaxID=2749268 RepID=A0A916VEQ4_9BACL|nr:polysaccharide deacetylase family protein [Insulibacter thermoxylanivorax]GFR36859.1 hypothetical protein PRECH8_01550 [Insulibacter thermoxylanivorax]